MYLELTPTTGAAGTPQTVILPVIGEANASDRTAPRRTVTVDRAVIVAALDAWQGYCEAEDEDFIAALESGAWDALAEAMAELNAEVRP